MTRRELEAHGEDVLHRHYDPDDYRWLPPEFLLDNTHPGNNLYIKNLHHIERALNDQKARCKPRHVELVRALVNGLSPLQAAAKAGYKHPHPILKRPEVKRLLALSRHFQQALDGPNVATRIAMLYRIAVNNEHDEPKTSIQAIEVINKMTGLYDQNSLAPQVIKIQFDHQLLPRTELDQLPTGVTLDALPPPPEST
jgi:hypothetical protein